VSAGDVIVADEDGVIVVPSAESVAVLDGAQARAARDAGLSLRQWRDDHQRRIAEALRQQGFTEPEPPR
jgi:regulator of RNase E activity RraA